ncbi:MAG: tRNA pseudouridine synthase [Micavibrio sp.]|nr:tRNA pseudouridine synthase [Micavibrio sp.]
MKRKGDIINGWIALDKPAGLTSTQAIGKIRRILNPAKIGHGGTLDPLATGILPIAMGEATKTIPFIVDHIKTYTFTVHWGEQRSTDDLEGGVIATSPNRPTAEEIRAILPNFTGDILQTPPQFSAIKIDGERAYDLARSGEDVDLKPRPVFIESLDLVSSEADQASFRCVCGKGTYIRSLGRDMGLALGTVGYIGALRREKVGPMDQNMAISLEMLEQTGHSAVLPVETVLDGIPALKLNSQEAARLKQGQKLSFIARPDVERLRKLGEGDALAVYDGKAVALVTIEGVEVFPVRIFNL